MSTVGTGITRRRGLHAGLAAITFLVVAAATGCGLTGDDESAADVDSRVAESTTTTTAAATTVDGSDTDTGDTGEGDGGTELDRDRSDASSDIERRVSETLSDLDAEVREGNTVITLPEQVLFAFDEFTLLPEAAETLDGIAEAIGYFDTAPVRVAGHTDARGSDAYNQTLSERRAQAVVDHLVAAGVEPGRITSAGFGETRPVAPNTNDDGSDDPEGRARNRRVEIVLEGVVPDDVGG